MPLFLKLPSFKTNQNEKTKKKATRPFFLLFVGSPSPLLASPFLSLSLLVVTQIRGHTAGSSLFSTPPPTVIDLHFNREKTPALSPLVNSRRTALGWIRLDAWGALPRGRADASGISKAGPRFIHAPSESRNSAFARNHRRLTLPVPGFPDSIQEQSPRAAAGSRNGHATLTPQRHCCKHVEPLSAALKSTTINSHYSD